MGPLPQLRLAPLYRQRLKAFGVRNVDSIIVLPSAAELMAMPPAGAEAAGADASPGAGGTQAAQSPAPAPAMSLAA